MKGLELLVSHKDEKKYVLIIGCGRLGASLANEIYSQGNDAVSYTHLDVYKRQGLLCPVPLYNYCCPSA